MISGTFDDYLLVIHMSVLYQQKHNQPHCGMRSGGLQLGPVKGFAVVHEAGLIAGGLRLLDAKEMMKLQPLPLHDLELKSRLVFIISIQEVLLPTGQA